MKKIFILALLAFSATAFAQSGTVEKKDEPKDTAEAVIVGVPEVMSLFPGGDAALYEWIYSHAKYPASCMEAGIEGKVSVKFVVEQDGSIGNVEIVRAPHEDLGKEAERVIRSLPKWKPAMQGGRPVRSYYSLPVTFKLPDNFKNPKSGVKGTSEDLSFEAYLAEADLGDAEAQARVAEMYMNGKGVKANDKMAEKYALKSAQKGNARGAVVLVLYYYIQGSEAEMVSAIDKYIVPNEDAQQLFIAQDAKKSPYPKACMQDYIAATYKNSSVKTLMKKAPKKVAFISRWNMRSQEQ